MAESAIEKLKRLAREKKEAATKAAQVAQPVVALANPASGEAGALTASAPTPVDNTEADAQLAKLRLDPEIFVENSEANLELRVKLSAEKLANERRALVSEDQALQEPKSEAGSDGSGTPVDGGSEESVGGSSSGIQTETKDVQTTSGNPAGSVLATDVKPTNSTHPLAMEFAEMEQALLTKDPEFKMILRNIHRHLALDPDLVTQMSEAEIQSVVSGLVVMANAEVVEPAKAKATKAKVAAAKKQVITADDL